LQQIIKEKNVEGYIEPENVFITFLQNAQESKKLSGNKLK